MLKQLQVPPRAGYWLSSLLLMQMLRLLSKMRRVSLQARRSPELSRCLVQTSYGKVKTRRTGAPNIHTSEG